MFDLTKYSFVNSKIRAMLSYLLSPASFERLSEARDINDMIDILKNTPYRAIADEFHRGHIELENLEREFSREDLRIHKKVCNMFSTDDEKKFIVLLLERYEIEELKVILRAWHKKIPINLNDYVLSDKINYDIDFKKILSAETLDEIMLLLNQTPYERPLISARKKFLEHNSTFYLEVALDSDFYERLLAAVNKFSPSDKKVARKLLGIEIDIENINSLIRFRKYYSLSTDTVMDLVIAGGGSVSKDKAKKIYETEDLSNIFEGVAAEINMKLNDENAHSIESFLYAILLYQVKRILAGFPFTIGTVMGYLILKRRETRNLVSLFYGKSLGVKKEETSALLNI